MKNLLIAIFLLGACGLDETNSPATTTSEQHVVEPSAYVQWMVGTWDCGVRYRTNVPYKAHATTGVLIYELLDLTESSATVVGTYTEVPVADFPVADYTDLIQTNFEASPTGGVVAALERSGTDGTHATASGTFSGPFFTSLGSLAVRGTETFSDSPAKPWMALLIRNDNETSSIPPFFKDNDHAGTDVAGRFFEYRAAECFLRLRN